MQKSNMQDVTTVNELQHQIAPKCMDLLYIAQNASQFKQRINNK